MPKAKYEGECRVEGCAQPIRWVAELLCNAHELKMRRHGDPLYVAPRQQYLTCTIDGCQRDQQFRTQPYCRPHLEAFKKYGDPLYRAPRGVPKGTPQQGRPLKGDNPGYNAIHRRLRRTRGAASSRNCIACGKQAREWAYQGGDPDELTTDPALRCENNDMKYSTDLTFYQPMCTRCHRLMDGSLDHTKARDAAGRWGTE